MFCWTQVTAKLVDFTWKPVDKPQTLLENRSDKGRMPENLSSWWASSPSAPKRHGTITVWLFWVRHEKQRLVETTVLQRNIVCMPMSDLQDFQHTIKLRVVVHPTKCTKDIRYSLWIYANGILHIVYMSLQCIVTSWMQIFDRSLSGRDQAF